MTFKASNKEDKPSPKHFPVLVLEVGVFKESLKRSSRNKRPNILVVLEM